MEIIGRLTSDAKVNKLKDERQIMNFTIAMNDYYKSKGAEGRKITTYVQCAYWINSSLAEHLTKGTLVELYGRIGVNAYTGKDGEAKAGLTFHVNAIRLHGKGKTENNSIAAPLPDTTQHNEDAEDLPF